MASPPTGKPDPCLICHNPEGRLCVACHCVAYCSKECQRSDWRSHQKICPQLNTQPERPEDGEFKRAIVFKADEDKPRLVWLEVQRLQDPDNEGKTRTPTARPIADFLACTVDAVTGLGFQRNVRRERDLKHTLVVNFCISDTDKVNYCIREATDLRNFHDFSGAIIVSKFTGFTPQELECADVEAEDYLDITDFLVTFGDPEYRLQSHLLDSTRFESHFDLPDFRTLNLGPDTPDEQDAQVKEDPKEASPPLTPQDDKKMAKCVRIACMGDVLGGSVKFAQAELPLSDLTMYDASNVASSQAYYSSHISQLVGMPICLRRVMREHGEREADFFNPEATLLLTELMNTSSDNWGWPPPHWQAHYGVVGSVVAMREDGKDLTVQQVRNLCEFAQMVARPLTQTALEGEMKIVDCKNLYLTQEKMEDFVRMKRLGMRE
ncbi:hypothetical protein HDK77DRAFT_489631 [Phyllosticta capitalensis]|uniref:uncharacterized protein n=1 Tax=Phyllosticta capitalensis TaxID=121624 RepID=UPI003130BC8F